MSKERGEHIPRAQLTGLAKRRGIPIDDEKVANWKLSTRSLLNRDTAGNYKFVHRSIMEYLFVKRFVEGDRRCLEMEWTDQMLTFYWEILERHIVLHRRLPFYDSDSPFGPPLEDSHIIFIQRLAVHGLSQLRDPSIALKRFRSILETSIANCALLLDPRLIDDPIVALLAVKISPNSDLILTPIAIHYGGELKDPRESEGLSRYSSASDPSFYGDHIPDIDTSNYEESLQRLVRVNAGGASVTMPIKLRGKHLAVLIGETNRSSAFRDNRHLMLIGILKQLGKYMWEYRL